MYLRCPNYVRTFYVCVCVWCDFDTLIKGVLLSYFTKSWFWGCTRTYAWWFENRIIYFTELTLLQYLSPQSDTNDSISFGFDEGPPSEKQNVLWLVGCHSALWLANSLDGVSVLPRHFAKQQAISIHIDQWSAKGGQNWPASNNIWPAARLFW